MVSLEDLKDKDPEAALEELKREVIADIEDKVRILKGDYENYPDSKAVVCVHTKYLSNGIKKEPNDEQRGELSALCKIHKRIMDKVKESTDFSETLVYGTLLGIVTDMMKEIENG
jgi:hypothetical protein